MAVSGPVFRHQVTLAALGDSMNAPKAQRPERRIN